MPQIEVNHKPLYYELAGEGETLVLVHAALVDSRLWQSQLAFFSEHFQVLTYDLYGYGKSAFTGEKKINHEDDLALLLDKLGIEHAHLLGASLGGEMVQRFALEYPERVRSLILVGAGLEGYDYPEDAFAWWARFANAMQSDDFEQAGSIFIENAFNSTGAPLTPEQLTTLQAMVKDYSFRHYVDDMLLWKSYDSPVIERLNEISCPTLVIVGEADTPTNQAIAQFLANSVDSASLITIAYAGHLPNLQQPETFNESVLHFLSKIEA
ncbi:MAG: alpha/beta hydrolase [Chloroflexi bacterium]|nr:alpha/beta hydrolase [Chloroflexota bacterium]